jgi:hypothetical protein
MTKKIRITETERAVFRVIRSQQLKGRHRYGEALTYRQESNPIRWVEEAIEECADMLQYLVALKMCLQKGVKK